MSEILIRRARAEDVPLLYDLIKKMSDYERLPLKTTEQQLLLDGFGEAPLFQTYVAFVDEQPAGYALTHGCYSDFEGRGLFLESLYINDPFRGHGVAECLLSEICRIARDQQSFGIVLNILRWNSRALAFFQKAGAVELDDRGTFVIQTGASAPNPGLQTRRASHRHRG
jgi:GNAT superfamily N-acetyltransferase